METIKTKQFRAIKRGFLNDQIFTRNDCMGYLKSPIMGKPVNGIQYTTTKKANLLKSLELTTKNTAFKLYVIEFGHVSQGHFVITYNDKILYHCFSSIFAPASSAWHTLTEVYHGYGKTSNWLWFSKNRVTNAINLPESKYEHIIETRQTSNETEINEAINNLYYHY